MRTMLTISVAVGALLLAAEASAQQPAAPAAVPDAMPFDIPYGRSITADRAAQLAQTVMAEARKGARNWKLAIAVVDTNGDLVYFYKMDQTQVASTTIAVGKARTAVRLRRATQVFFDQMQTPAGSYIPTLDPTLIASPGGIPLVENGVLIGAIGCSGAMGSQDAVACAAGAATLK
jgi:glc operon protein GlcG